MGYDMANVGRAIASGLQSASQKSAQAAATANGVSAAAQSAQGAFNQGSANIANALGSDRVAQQYAFNSAQAQMANDFSAAMWDKTAGWNEMMWEKQAAFNAAEAQKQRDWQERMSNTAYQRAIKDLAAAGLNPIMAVTGGGLSGASLGGSGSAASVNGTNMSPITGQMGSGGLINGVSASEGNYSGQMEYMAGTLGLFGAAMTGLSTAFQSFGGMGEFGEALGKALGMAMGSDNPLKDPIGTIKGIGNTAKKAWDKFNEWNWKDSETNKKFKDYKSPTFEYFNK